MLNSYRLLSSLLPHSPPPFAEKKNGVPKKLTLTFSHTQIHRNFPELPEPRLECHQKPWLFAAVHFHLRCRQPLLDRRQGPKYLTGAGCRWRHPGRRGAWVLHCRRDDWPLQAHRIPWPDCPPLKCLSPQERWDNRRACRWYHLILEAEDGARDNGIRSQIPMSTMDWWLR